MSGTCALKINSISKRFGQLLALDQVNFEVPDQCVFGLVGPNGAGKTTLFSLVAGFLKPTTGSIEVLGINVENISALMGKLSILPQDAQFQANVPVLEQLIFFSQLSGCNRQEAEKQAYKALEIVGLSDSAKKGARVLSHGMTKRLGIAQAFLGNPKVILLDEPTAGLDPKAAHDIRVLIEDFNKARSTVIISSHNLFEIQKMCEYVAILDKGKLVECNKVSEITRADKQVRMAFNRSLTEAELSVVRGVSGVSEINPDENNSYLIILDVQSKNHNQDEIVTEIVKGLVTTGAVPRSIESGVALESRFIEVTQKKS